MRNASTLMMDTTVLVAVATQEMELHVTVCFSILVTTVYSSMYNESSKILFPDINECSTGSAECDENAECYDTAGSYDCTCFSGYIGDGYTCQDIDECLTHPCDENATCTNNNGSFSCQCNTGFSGNGTLCSGTIILISHLW